MPQTLTFEILDSEDLRHDLTNFLEFASTDTIGEQGTVAYCDATGGAFTLTLPDAAAYKHRLLILIKVDVSANAVTIDGEGAQTINGVATQSLAAQWDVLRIASDGSNWINV